ncbi:TonB family protein [Taibaiella koreensis]|uniref:TonB family protein n=1 Tax=Taibaiella koreensis TaxID=1268548 RepID=UPI000E59F8F4|nr:TonB family protein [Taibaiella koreensis]
MRVQLILFAFLVCSFTVVGQDTLHFYFNGKWEQEQEMDKAVYHRKAVAVSEGWYVMDYYSKSMKPRMSGTFTSLEKEVKQGMFVYYYENGNREKAGRFYSDYRMGSWQTWYRDGTLRSKENYVEREGLVDTLIKEGVVAFGGNIMDVMYIVEQKGVFDGKSEWFYPNGQISSEEEWKVKLLSVEHWNEKGKKEPINKDRPSLLFPAGIAEVPLTNMRAFIEAAGKKNIKGKMLLELYIDAEGHMENASVQKSSGEYKTDREIVTLLEYHNPVWIPGKIHNLPERMKVNLPLSFR